MNRKELQQAMLDAKPMINMTKEEFNYSQKPMGKAIYKNSVRGRPKIAEEDKAKPDDKLICETCKGTFTRRHRKRHNSSRIHLAHANINKKLLELIIDK